MTFSIVKAALRKAGYVRLPTLWVLPDEAEVIYRIAEKHKRDVHRITRAALHPEDEDR